MINFSYDKRSRRKSVSTGTFKGGVPIGSGFLRGMQMLVVSLVLCSLVCGAIAIGGSQKLGNFFCSYLER